MEREGEVLSDGIYKCNVDVEYKRKQCYYRSDVIMMMIPRLLASSSSSLG